MRSLFVMRIWRWVLRSQEAPLLGSVYKSDSHQESLGGYGFFRKSYPTKHSLSSGNFREEDSGMLNGSDRIQGKRQVHHRPHSTMAEGGSNSLHGLLPCGKNGSLIPCASGKTMVT